MGLQGLSFLGPVVSRGRWKFQGETGQWAWNDRKSWQITEEELQGEELQGEEEDPAHHCSQQELDEQL
jgi:hypothetical protein